MSLPLVSTGTRGMRLRHQDMTIKNSEDTPKKESSSQEEPSLDSLLASSRLFFNVMSWFLNGIRKGRRIPTIFN